MENHVPPAGRPRLLLGWIGLTSAWVLAGAAFKLFWGTPALLPPLVRRAPFELGVTYNLAIGIELAIAAVALTRPRWGWLLLSALFVVFDVVLTTQIAAGATNCGCFGAKFSMRPELMLGIDSVLLVGLLAQRPWKRLGPGLPPLVPIALAALALALPWFLDRQVKEGEVVADGEVVREAWQALELEKWVGQEIWDTPLNKPPLAQYIDVNQLPLDGLWVFWRATCEHCAAHLEHMETAETGQRLLTLVQLEERSDTLANRVVHRMPSGNFVKMVTLPPAFTYVLQTPAELLLEGGKVVAAKEGVTPETGL